MQPALPELRRPLARRDARRARRGTRSSTRATPTGRPRPGRAPSRREPYEVEYRFKRASDGSYRWFLARGTPVRDADGRVSRWVGTCTDIDDRKRSDETHRFLAEAGALLASSLDYRATLATLTRLAVPAMADWCAVDLLDDAARSSASPSRTPTRAGSSWCGRSNGATPEPDEGARRVLRTGVAERARRSPARCSRRPRATRSTSS
ncbi:MAG: PAS domain-containing protein [Polyangiales bacterium]